MANLSWLKTEKLRRIETAANRSAHLEEIVDRLFDGHQPDRLQAKPARGNGPLTATIRTRSEICSGAQGGSFPVDWTDPVELYGCIREVLIPFEIDLERERRELARVVFDKGPERVWKNRLRLVAGKIFCFRSDDGPKRRTEVPRDRSVCTFPGFGNVQAI
jgi:hypothetical protein